MAANLAVPKVVALADSATRAELVAAQAAPAVPVRPPAPPGGVEFLVYQLDVEQKLFGYALVPDHAERNRLATRKLAEFLLMHSIPDVRELAVQFGTVKRTRMDTGCADSGDASYCWSNPVQFSCSALWFYNKRSGARIGLGEQLGPDCCVPGFVDSGDAGFVIDCTNPALNPPLPRPDEPVRLFSIDLPDRYWAHIFVVFVGPQKVAAFVAKITREQSRWQSIRAAILFWFGAVSLVVPGLNVAIASAVFGAQVAAAYPLLVSLATNTAFNAVLGGLDIEHAVGRALASYAGGVVGAGAGSAFDSALVARVTGAATTAALTGGNIEQAAVMSALQFTATNAPELLAPKPVAPAAIVGTALAPTFQPAPLAAPAQGATMYGDDELGYGLDADAAGFEYVYGGEIIDMGAGFDAQVLDFGAELGVDDFAQFSDDGSLFYPGDIVLAPEGAGYDFDPEGGFVGPPEGGRAPLPANLPPQSPSDGNGFDWGDALGNVTAFALKAYQVYVATHPASNNAPIRAPGPSQVVNPGSGIITTRSPTGTVTTGRPPVGQTVAAADGTLLTNNGNGTYTVIRPDGTVQTLAYSATPGAGGAGLLGPMDNTKLLLVGGLALGGLYLLTQRR